MFITKSVIGLITDYFCTIYIYTKMPKTALTKTQKIIVFISAVLISVFSSLLRYYNNPFYGIVFFVLTIISILVFSKSIELVTISKAFISLGIQYFAETISIIILVTLFYALSYYETNIFTELCTSVLQFIFVFLFTKIKRVQRRFVFLINKNNIGLSLLISGPIIILTNLQKEYIPYINLLVIIFGIVISGIGLVIWIRSAFTRHYRKRLKLRAEEYSKIELAEKSKEIEKLTSENTSLSSIIHLDNHIIQSIETELNNLNNSELTNKLLISINQRNEYVNDTLVKSKNLPTTGSADIDAVLADLYIKAASRGIDYNLNVDCDINYLLNNLISKEDFEILLRETITNSIVSVETNPDSPGRIFINISQPNDIYELTIMDNGINTYDINSISEIIKKSNASILTKNFDDNDSFTNSITVRFDGLNTNTQ